MARTPVLPEANQVRPVSALTCRSAYAAPRLSKTYNAVNHVMPGQTLETFWVRLLAQDNFRLDWTRLCGRRKALRRLDRLRRTLVGTK